MTRRDLALASVVPVILLIVVAVGTWAVHTHDQTVWRGGTFGMFASADAPANRLVRGLVVAEGGDEVFVVLPPASVADQAERALVRPDQGSVDSLYEVWRKAELDGELVAVEVWRTIFDPAGPSVKMERLASAGPGPPQ